jgi:hypothetical protein
LAGRWACALLGSQAASAPVRGVGRGGWGGSTGRVGLRPTGWGRSRRGTRGLRWMGPRPMGSRRPIRRCSQKKLNPPSLSGCAQPTQPPTPNPQPHQATARWSSRWTACAEPAGRSSRAGRAPTVSARRPSLGAPPPHTHPPTHPHSHTHTLPPLGPRCLSWRPPGLLSGACSAQRGAGSDGEHPSVARPPNRAGPSRPKRPLGACLAHPVALCPRPPLGLRAASTVGCGQRPPSPWLPSPHFCLHPTPPHPTPRDKLPISHHHQPNHQPDHHFAPLNA